MIEQIPKLNLNQAADMGCAARLFVRPYETYDCRRVSAFHTLVRLPQ